MSARFAEKCSPTPLKLRGSEERILEANKDAPNCLRCEEDIHLGFFFDGTNNNKYRDTPGNCHSNVARLYEAYPGEATVKQLAIARGEPKPDETATWSKQRASDKANYRKTYIPGVGTPFKELGDTGLNGFVTENGKQREISDRKDGLGFATHGEARICWALLQVTNHLHSILGTPDPQRWVQDAKLARRMANANGQWDKILEAYDLGRDDSGSAVRARILQRCAAELAQAIAQRQPLQRRTPRLRRIRVSVFGFSRGAAKARVFLNWLREAYGGGIAGLPLTVDFIGVFDTVASVGLANWGPSVGMDGHYGWASIRNMAIPDGIRCVHLVAAHEVRG
ncbi:DUF2235 domain-containing protein [Chitiniphilus purpureus]|uniref:DUF2235 domain-containing protein n=1 Tax=Chitiniphilus purpureus TaxID=2981137 RepID=A0ABY6DLC0_9NEIS|nr:DUF2235 domain-containing protein [Chitiniphilus sp. CD1]UXY15136.1 DUF2235 domain-containing protein [Chitiniphilus sp. CD1]